MHAPEHQQRDGVDHHGRSNLYAAIKVHTHMGKATMSTMSAQCATISTLRPVRLSVLITGRVQFLRGAIDCPRCCNDVAMIWRWSAETAARQLMDFSQNLAQRPAIPWPDNVGLYCSPLPTPSF